MTLMYSRTQEHRTLSRIYWSALVVVMLLCAARPVEDPDFWWHLLSGKRMWHDGRLIDPTTVVTSDLLRARVILHGYWVWELVTYSLYFCFGMVGVLLMKILTVLSLVSVIGWRMARLQIQPGVIMICCTLGFALVGPSYFIERPQIFSFLFAALTLGFFDQVRESGRLNWLLLPLMVVWGNTHGGVLVGDLLLLLFGLGMIWEWRRHRKDLVRLLVWVGAGIAASMLQPIGWEIFMILFNHDDYRSLYSTISEYQSTFDAFRGKDGWGYLALWLLMVVHGFGLILAKRRWLPDILIFGFLAFFCARYIRNVGFFALSLLPVTAWYVNQILVSRQVVRIASFAALVGVLGFGLTQAERVSRDPGIVSSRIPRALADFLVLNGVRGSIFNDYDWGGYLLWRMAPNNPLMVDGRTLNLAAFADHSRVLLADWSGDPVNNEALEVLRKYDIQILAVKHTYAFGSIFPLTRYLLNSGAWVPVYADKLGYILVQRDKQPQLLIQEHSMTACALYATMAKVIDQPEVQQGNKELWTQARATLAAQLESCSQMVAPT